jgi:hypothetical protein
LIVRTWLTVAALLILPLVVYWSTATHEYGFRDDYAHLREVRERPGWLTTLTTAHGRPVYGAALEASLRNVDRVEELAALRLTSALLIGVAGLLLWSQLRRSGWTEMQAAAMGAAVTLLPGMQVVAGWAIAWPIALGLIAALAGFALVECGFGATGFRRAWSVAAGGALYVLAGVTYQTSALFVVVPLAAVLLLRQRATIRDDAWWVVAHIGLLFVCLVVGFVASRALMVEGAVPEATRTTLEPDIWLKFLWFLRNPVPNSIGLFALRDGIATPLGFWLVVAGVTALMLLGFVLGATNRQQRLRWLFAALLLPFVAHSVSLAASSQAIGYRTLLPLSGLFLVLAMFGLRSAAARYRVPRAAEAGVLAAVLVVAALLAQRNPWALLAEPQSREWDLIQAGANRLQPADHASVYIIRPTIDDRSTERIYADEYGTLTADADWAAKEMFKAAMRERFPAGLPAGAQYELYTGFGPPPAQYSYDLVVDLRALKSLGERAPAATTASQR